MNNPRPFPFPALRAWFASACLAFLLPANAAGANDFFVGEWIFASPAEVQGSSSEGYALIIDEWFGGVSTSWPEQTFVPDGYITGFSAREPLRFTGTNVDVYHSFSPPGQTRLYGNDGLAQVSRSFPSATIGVGESIRLSLTMNASGLEDNQRRIGFALGFIDSYPLFPTSSVLWRPFGNGYIHGVPDDGSEPADGLLIWLEETTETASDGFTGVPVELLLARSATGYDMTVTFGESILSASHEGSLNSFNVVAFGVDGVQFGATYWFDDLSVTVIPEPSASAALFALGSFLAVLYGRRRSATLCRG